MKITSGIYKNRNIDSPHTNSTHPMGERERLALFNMLGQDLTGLMVLDAYAGSGILGIEALSRKAAKVVFVEKFPAAVRTIHENLRSLGVAEDSTQVICKDVNKVTFDEDFDVILADPPYDNFNVLEIENLTKCLKDSGILILSHPGVAPAINGLTLEKTRQYARAHISFYTK